MKGVRGWRARNGVELTPGSLRSRSLPTPSPPFQIIFALSALSPMSPVTPTPEQYEALIAAAVSAKEGSYSPYSNFRVGAALLAVDGSIIKGANIENASYGAGVCAERTALVKAVVSTIPSPSAERPVRAHGELVSPSGGVGLRPPDDSLWWSPDLHAARTTTKLALTPSPAGSRSQSDGTNRFLAIAVSS